MACAAETAADGMSPIDAIKYQGHENDVVALYVEDSRITSRDVRAVRERMRALRSLTVVST